VRTDRLSEVEVRAWRALAERAAEPNPFFSPEYVLAAAHGRGEPADLLIVTRGGRWEACVPFQRAGRWRWLPLPCLAPWLRTYAYLATPLVDRDAVDPATAALGRALAGARRAAFAVLDPVDPEGPVGAALLSSVDRAVVYTDARRAAIRRRAEPTYLDGSFSAKRWKRLARLRRRLESDLGGAVVVRNRSQDPAAWDRFLDLELRTWKGARGTAIASQEGDAAFFRLMCAAMSSLGKLQVLSLECGDRVAAMQCNLVDGGVVFALKVAYEPELARYAPGILLEIDSVFVFHDLRAEMMDSCAEPTNDLMNALWPDRRRVQTVIVPTAAPAGRAVPALARMHLAAAHIAHASQFLARARPGKQEGYDGRGKGPSSRRRPEGVAWQNRGARGRSTYADGLAPAESRRLSRMSDERIEW
jgi:CelD/BcsL family acetyltransferase involved in cellulose biosynthesis